jgi:cytochrome P450
MLTWAVSELSRHPELQTRLRAELSEAFPGGDPTVDELANGAPFLDAFVNETLRLHHLTPPFVRTVRSHAILYVNFQSHLST